MPVKKHILFVASQTDNRANGGAESATRIYEALADYFQWSFITTHESDFTRRWRRSGAAVTVVPFDTGSSIAKRLVQWTHWYLRVVWLMLRNRPDCVHANDIRACRIAALPARLLRIPLLFTVRDSKSPHEWYGGHWHRATKHCKRVITLSKEMAAEVSDRIGVPKNLIVAINSIVDTHKFAPVRASDRRVRRRALNIGDGEFAIGVVGVIREKKGQLALIENTLPELFARITNAKVYFLGDFEPDRDAYAAKSRDAVESLGLAERVIFYGHSTEIVDWYKALDMVLVPSQYEGLARCMIEAMASGVPVVSFDVCSAREMLEDTGAGLVVPQGDYESLIGAIEQLAMEKEQQEAMAVAGRSAAERYFAPERIATEYLALYEELF